MKKKILALVISTVILAGCGPKELSPEEKHQVETLTNELKSTNEDIAYSKEQENKYSGGIIKSLLVAKLQVLETNKALIQQRINAIESGAKVDVVIKGATPDPALADSIKSEIDSLKVEIDKSKKEASQYSGGLIFALKSSTVAMQEQSLALLEQKYLSAKYGLAEIGSIKPSISKGADSSTNLPPKTAEPAIPPGEGPFGLEEGLSKDDIEKMISSPLTLVEGTKNLYLTSSIPKGNDSFENYGLLISPKVGLCQIRAIGKTISTDSFGIAIKSKFNEMRELLDSIYGSGKESDFLLTGSIWKDPQDWMMSLYKKERALSSDWSQKNDAMNKNKLTYIGLDSRAISNQEGYIFLQYTFSNNPTCDLEEEAEKKSSL